MLSKKQSRPSGNREKLHLCRSWSPQGTWATTGTPQQGSGWFLTTAPCHGRARGQREETPQGLLLTHEEELLRDEKVMSGLGCTGHEVVEFQISRGVSRTTSLNITVLGAGGTDWSVQGLAWGNPTGHRLGENRSPGYPVDCHGSCPPSSRTIHLRPLETKQW